MPKNALLQEKTDNWIDSNLNDEVGSKNSVFKALRKAQIDLRRILWLESYAWCIDFFSSGHRINIAKTPITWYQANLENELDRNRFSQLFPNVEIDVWDEILQIHMWIKPISIEGKEDWRSLRRLIIEWFSSLQSYLKQCPDGCLPKYVTWTSFIASKLGLLWFDVYDPRELRTETSVYRLLDRSKTFELVIWFHDKIRDIITYVASHAPVARWRLWDFVHNNRYYAKSNRERSKVRKKYTSDDIRSAIIDIDKFMEIDFKRMLERL